MSGEQPLTVSVPVPLVDSLLPHLKDTELRVLLVLLRQLRVTGQERERVWLTHSELCRRTGRASEAISAAVARLSEARLLSVHDETGQALKSAAARQHSAGRRYFRLSEQAFPLTDPPGSETKRTPIAKAKTIENKEDIYSFRFSGQPLRFPEEGKEPGHSQPDRNQETLLTHERRAEEKRRIRETLAGIRVLDRLPRTALTRQRHSGMPGAAKPSTTANNHSA